MLGGLIDDTSYVPLLQRRTTDNGQSAQSNDQISSHHDQQIPRRRNFRKRREDSDAHPAAGQPAHPKLLKILKNIETAQQ